MSAGELWSRAYADPRSWPKWNGALASAELEGPFQAGSRVRVRFRSGLRLRFELVEVEPERLFTDESRLPGARMGHRHAIEPITGGVRLSNTIYIAGPLSSLWSLILGAQAKRGLAGWQQRAADLARS